MPKDRDVHEPRVAPPHIRAQTARPVPIEVDEDTSQRYDIGPERDAYRAKRDTKERLGKAETKIDTLAEGMAGLKGSVDTLVMLQTKADDRAAAADAAAAERAKLRAEALEKQNDRKLKVRLALIAIIVPLATALGIAQAIK